MANVFKRLTRGIKLLVEHVFDPLEQTMALLTTSGVTADYYEKEEGTFRIALNFPYISPIVKEADSDRATTATSVFMLPALQDEFDNDNQAIEGYELLLEAGHPLRSLLAPLKYLQVQRTHLRTTFINFRSLRLL